MRRSMNVILTVIVICSLVLAAQHSILAQAKSKQKSQRDMPQQRIGEQTKRKIKAKDDIKSERTQISGVERYRAIIRNNLFMPLGSGGEVKRKEFILAGILGNSAFIQMEGSDKSFYVAEGQSFGNDVKLVQVGNNSVTIIHEGNKKELKLLSGVPVSGAPAGQDRSAKGGKSRQRQEKSGKSSRKMESANRSGKERGSGSEKQGGDNNWARNMSIGELSKVRGDIASYIEELEEKGVRDPDVYEGAYEKMEAVENAMAEKGEDKDDD